MANLPALRLLLVLLLNSLLAAGAALPVVALFHWLRKKPYPLRRDPARLGLIGALTLLVAAPLRALIPAAPAVRRHAAPELNTPGRFASASDPAFRLVAPPGWTLKYDADERVLRAFRGGTSLENATAMLKVSSSLLSHDANPVTLADGLRKPFAEQGYSVNDPLSAATIAGAPAQLLVASRPEVDLCSWIVLRGRRYVTAVQCADRGVHCTQACQPVIAQLVWLKPLDIQASDLGD